MSKMGAVSLSLALASAGVMLPAADLSIAEGEDVTLSESANYGTVTVLGNLTLAEDVVVTATVVTCENEAGAKATVTLKEGSQLVSASPWQTAGAGSFEIDFEGGQASFSQFRRTGTGTTTFKGVGYPIRIEVTGSTDPQFMTDSTAHYVFTGNGGLERTGTSANRFNDKNSGCFTMDYSGDTVIKSGTWNFQNVQLPATTDLKIARGAAFVTFSQSFEVNSISGDGAIRDGGYAVPVTLAGEGNDFEFACFDTASGSITKNGPCSATIAPRNAFTKLVVNEGTLGVKSRAEAGFVRYQYANGKVRSGTTLVVSEFRIFDGAGTDVTGLRSNDLGPVQDGWTSALYDGNLVTKWWTSQGSAFAVDYAQATQVLGYNLATSPNPSDYDPVSWTFRACLDPSNPKWVNLDVQTDYPAPTERQVFYSVNPLPVYGTLREVAVGTATIAPSATLAVKGLTTLVASNLTARSGQVGLTGGGRLALVAGAGEEKSEWYFTTTGEGALEKRGAGVYTLNEATVGADVCVREGTLKLASGFAETNTWFRFEFLKVKNGGTQLQFGKIRFYDAAYAPHTGGWNESVRKFWGLFSGDPEVPEDEIGDGIYVPMPASFSIKPGAGMIGYRFADVASGGDSKKTPSEWNVYVGSAENGPWTLIDHREMTTTDGVRGWKAYGDGMYFYFTNRYNTAKSTIAAGRSVTICRGATLDVTETKAVLDDLVIDGTGSGNATLKGGELAATGTLALNGVSLADNGAVPLLLDGTSLPEDLADWTVKVDGVAKPRWRLAVCDGALVIEKPGLTILLK